MYYMLCIGGIQRPWYHDSGDVFQRKVSLLECDYTLDT